MKFSCRRAINFFLLSVAFTSILAQKTTIEVDVSKPGAEIKSTMYGLFFEDINFAADGGLYGELIKNRSFEFDNPLMGWNAFGNVCIREYKPCFDKNPHYAQISFGNELSGCGIENEGFRGIGIKAGEKYHFTFFGRGKDTLSIKVKVELLAADNQILATKKLEIKGNSWKKYETDLSAGSTHRNARLRLMLDSKGTVDFDHISLFPTKTFKNRPGGLRSDLAEALAEIKPGLLRFPGGCIVEGTTLNSRYQWKNTIGPVENRPVNINRWNYTFAHRRFPDYYQSLGLGFFEYFLLCEDIGAEPLPVLNCGLSCQFENYNDKQNCQLDSLQNYIQDALDLIEFANGSTTSKWGKVRAEMGHPTPFNLKFLAIGNEQWGEKYTKRFEPFIKALRKFYPQIKIVGSAGPYPGGKDFDYGWNAMKRLNADLVDEHYYQSPDWFLKNTNRYDNYDRKGPKVFAGEYACHVQSKGNTTEAALCEAAFMTGLERNADVVNMTAYAPLFAHVDAWQWRPDLIWFDNLNIVKTPSYYVQKLYSNYPGTNILKTILRNESLSDRDSIFVSNTIDKKRSELFLKIVNVSNQSKAFEYKVMGKKLKAQNAIKITLKQQSETDENTISEPENVKPEESTIAIPESNFELITQPKSFTVIIVKYEK